MKIKDGQIVLGEHEKDSPDVIGSPDARLDGPRRMTFGEAIEYLRTGARMARDGWNGKGMYVELQVPDAHSKMTLPYIFMRTAQGDLVPWLASQTDILARDWVVVS
jgi:hypothetical protein